MFNVPYIDYNVMDEFYTLKDVCELFCISKQELKKQCEKHNVKPHRNEIGDYGLVKYDVRKIHNAMYHEDRSHEEDPWSFDLPEVN